MAVIADSGRAMYETMVRPLSAAELEDLWQDYVRFGELFGLPRSEVPATYPEFKAWFDAKLASPDLQATEHALEMAPLVAFKQPVPLPPVATSPPRTTSSRGPCRPASARSSASPGAAPTSRPSGRWPPAHRRARRLFPKLVRRGRNDYFFDLVSRVERQRGGTRTPELDAGALSRPLPLGYPAT